MRESVFYVGFLAFEYSTVFVDAQVVTTCLMCTQIALLVLLLTKYGPTYLPPLILEML